MWEKTSNGMREVVTGYKSSDQLPGATVIPTNAGTFGGQRGVSLDDPINIVINPDTKDEVKLTTTDVKRYMRQAIREAGGNAEEAYKLIAAWKTAGEGQQVKKNDLADNLDSNRKRKKTVAIPPVSIESPVEKSEQRSDIPAIPADALQTALMHLLQGLLKPVAAQPAKGLPDLDQIVLPAVAAQQPPVRPFEEVDASPRPRVKVSFKSPRGGTFESFYHEVLLQDKLVILVYDTRFEFGAHSFPDASTEDVHQLTISSKDNGSVTRPVLYTGDMFKHGIYEYTVLPIPDEKE